MNDPAVRDLAASLRHLALRVLMLGQIEDFRVTMDDLTRPGAFAGDRIRVYVIDGPEQDREQIIADCLAAVGHAALVVACPVYRAETIIAVGEQHHPMVERALAELTTAHDGWHLGGSVPHDITKAADAYQAASAGLLRAHRIPRRVALAFFETRLADVVDPVRAQTWADDFLRPLRALSARRYDDVTVSVRNALAFGINSTARILWSHRNTVARHMDTAAELLRLDLGGLRDRSVLGLALEIAARTPVISTVDGPVYLFCEDGSGLLQTQEVALWAQAFLGRLDEDHRPLRATLRAWLGTDGKVAETAARLGVSSAAVRAHLKAIERLLRRRLFHGPADVVDGPARPEEPAGSHGVFLAAAVLGEVAVSRWPDRARAVAA